MKKPEIKAILLENGFKLKDQGEGVMDLNPYVYTAVQAVLRRENYRFDRLVEWAKTQDERIAELTARVNLFQLYERGEVWFWQNDGGNHPESLACPVLIEAPALRALIGLAPEAISDKYRADVKAVRDELQADFDQRLQNITGQLSAEMQRLRDAHSDEIADIKRAVGPTTYYSEQATSCAGCGVRKHTPLRIDSMGGYVCLTCINAKLSGFLELEGAKYAEKDWWGCTYVAEIPAVHEAFKVFSHDGTSDNATAVVQQIIQVLDADFIKMTGAEIASGFDRVHWAEQLIRQLPPEHEGAQSWLANYAENKPSPESSLHPAEEVGQLPSDPEYHDAKKGDEGR